MSVLVVAALREEVAHLSADAEVLVTGIGKALAASGLARRLAARPVPSLVVNVGTAGALAPHLLGVHEVAVVTQHDFPYDALEHLVGAAGPRAFRLSPDAPPSPVSVLTPADGVVLGTGDTFVADAATAAGLASRGIDLVDMEAFGYATTCAAFELPFRCVKAVSDRADGDAAGSWLELVDSCARDLAAWLRALED